MQTVYEKHKDTDGILYITYQERYSPPFFTLLRHMIIWRQYPCIKKTGSGGADPNINTRQTTASTCITKLTPAIVDSLRFTTPEKGSEAAMHAIMLYVEKTAHC